MYLNDIRRTYPSRPALSKSLVPTPAEEEEEEEEEEGEEGGGEASTMVKERNLMKEMGTSRYPLNENRG